MDAARTHLGIYPRLCGTAVEIAPGRAVVELETVPEMVADEHGLIHGGFVFGLADYAAMLAVNDPNVVLGSASLRFLAPVRLGETLRATARLDEHEGRKRRVDFEVRRSGEIVAAGEAVCIVPDRHVLAPR